MFDAASRLAQGRPAADTVQEYVWACHLIGYQDPDLTLHPSQVRDWYGSEDGLDLSALDADCEALRAAAASAEGILARQDAQRTLMSDAWQGPGAQVSRDFVRRHGEAAAAAVSAVRTAADSLASLRDRLWQSVDGKVATTVAVAERGANPEWRAAVQTVATGAGDRAAASELVDRDVKPFVADDIRGQWLTAMRSAIAAITDAYDAAVAEVISEVPVAFDVPSDLGPTWSPPATEVAGTSSVAAAPAVSSVAPPAFGAAPASGAPGSPPAWAAPPPGVPSSPPPLPAAPPVDPAAMAPPSLPSMGGGMPDIGSGLSGFGGQLGDMLGGLLGTSQDALSDLPESDELEKPDELEEPDELEDEKDEEVDEDEEADTSEPADAEPVADAVGEPPPDEPPVDPPPAEVEPAPTPVAAPPPMEPLAAPAPPTDGGTPCEIAANELPQVGE